jgi:hypothetical protein
LKLTLKVLLSAILCLIAAPKAHAWFERPDALQNICILNGAGSIEVLLLGGSVQHIGSVLAAQQNQKNFSYFQGSKCAGVPDSYVNANVWYIQNMSAQAALSQIQSSPSNTTSCVLNNASITGSCSAVGPYQINCIFPTCFTP